MPRTSNGLGSWRDRLEKPELKGGNHLKVIESMEIRQEKAQEAR
jgi:hypothetical protein